ncbi:MAG TPA: hypothetical protein PJ989_11420 [Oligoflexia bacterium]|nr:hypothetical protein [Oligoflexia bacterium]
MAVVSKNFVNPGESLWSFIESQVVDEKLRLYDIARPRPNLLRIFVDKNKEDSEKKGSGVSIDECVGLCRRLMHAFVVDGLELGVTSEPELEVSSPGLDRELRLLHHFLDAVGSRVKLWIEGGVVAGVLGSLNDGVLTVKDSDSSPAGEFRLADIRKAQIDF